MRPVEILGKIDGDGFFSDGAEALSRSSAVICRIGSLEMYSDRDYYHLDIICRIGSLKNQGTRRKESFDDVWKTIQKIRKTA